ncbi:MAG: hypothetical protein ACRD6W_04925 [Nitrososphaerales archaeon]
MVKWIQELLLQRYWQERCHEDAYYLEGSKILKARMNPMTDKFPDIIANEIAGLPQPVPAEVEWTTEDFRRHGHPVEKLAEQNGFLIVWKRTQDFPTTQIELHKPEFRDWLRQNYGRLLDDTLRDVEHAVGRGIDPRVWVVWRSGSVAHHMEIALAHGLWGFPRGLNLPRLMNAQAIRAGDTLVFVGPWIGKHVEGRRTGGRVDRRTFTHGEIEAVTAYTVTKGYFSDATEVWPIRGGEAWNHRVAFEPKPVFEARGLASTPSVLGPTLPEFLRKVMVGRSDPIELPPSLIATLLSAVGKRGH